MSITLTILGNEPVLQTFFHPPLNLDASYECGLLYFSAFNSIPNVTDRNNVFTYGDKKTEIKIPNGSYDITDLSEYLRKNVQNCEIQLQFDINTSTCSLFCSENIHFENSNSIGSLLGFPNVKLDANKWHVSVGPVNIHPVSLIRIECDLVQGSYTNGLTSHIIYEFVPNVPPSFRFLEKPKNIIYFPIVNNNVSTVALKIVDQAGELIDFCKEDIQTCLHLRKSK